LRLFNQKESVKQIDEFLTYLACVKIKFQLPDIDFSESKCQKGERDTNKQFSLEILAGQTAQKVKLKT